MKLEGSLIGGPPSVCEGSFPSSQFLVQLGFANGCAKQWEAATGVLTRNLQSPSALVALSGVGAGDTVTAGRVLYFKTNAEMLLEVTFHPSSGPDYVSLIPVRGPVVLETPDNSYIVGLRCQGTGPLEYLVAGSG